MASFEQHLFGRIAILNGYLTPEQLQECLEIQREARVSSPVRIGKILLERGFLTAEQLDRIVDIRRKKIRKISGGSEQQLAAERQFRKAALSRGDVTASDLEAAALEQQRLRGLGIQVPVWEALVSRGALGAEDVRQILRELGREVVFCAACDRYFELVQPGSRERARCDQCGGGLERPSFLDSVVIDERLGAGKAEGETEAEGIDIFELSP